jgi:hypothetical protein
VLSHLHDPIRIFERINKALMPGGILAFETGNIADVEEKYLRWFTQFLYPDHLFFFGERSLNLLLQRTGFEAIAIHRDAILLQLALQKALWRFKDSLKEKRVQQDLRQHKTNPNRSVRSLKRWIRLGYRYLGHYLVKAASVLPKQGRPLKLLVVARKKIEAEDTRAHGPNPIGDPVPPG